MEHTPGQYYVTDPKADSGRTWIVTGGLTPVRIAQVLTGPADANLLAAAPELLAAAEYYHDFMTMKPQPFYAKHPDFLLAKDEAGLKWSAIDYLLGKLEAAIAAATQAVPR